ncbi:hypothetical protein PABG_00987 [Paracoccidioides brasiliensis Pb03]|nr:hypothetical protein PABG_00987 [Paracoccidioides brasiliensis Pb03]
MTNSLSSIAAGDRRLPNSVESAKESCISQQNVSISVISTDPRRPSTTNTITAKSQSLSTQAEQPAMHAFKELHEEHSHPPLSTVVARLHEQVSSFLSESHDPTSILHRVQNRTCTSLRVIQEALHRFSLQDLSLSYNGGKDCLVMLILFLASLHPFPAATKTATSDNRKKSSTSSPPSTIPAIYAQPHHPFRSVEDFVASSSHAYHLSLVCYTTNPPHATIRSAFTSYLSLHPQIRAIFVGTRRTDPHGEKLTHFDRTDHGWPDFMRIHPVIDWHYAEIWAFIRHLGIEYCPLYDEGYTSLGGMNDTHPNPKLQIRDQDSDDDQHRKARYRPAYELMDDEEERLGRD